MWHNVSAMTSDTTTYNSEAKDAVKGLAAELGFDLVGIT